MNLDIINYEQLKIIIKQAIKNYKFISGSGGSNNLIIINQHYVIKIIPNLINNLLKIQSNRDILEGDHYIKLTEEYIKKKRCPHFVTIYKKYTILDANFIFPSHCPTIDQKINIPSHKLNQQLEKICFLKKSFEKGLLEKQLSVLVLENCSTDISTEAMLIFRSRARFVIKMELFIKLIHRVIFQFMFTLALLQDDYPNFIHNDMFLRNILGNYISEYNNNDYVEYNYQNKKYYLPANGFYLKINDFGYSLNLLSTPSTLVDEIKNTTDSLFEIKNPLRDVWTFLFDLYDGPNVGSRSLKSVIYDQIRNKKEQIIMIKLLQKQISRYLKYQVIDKINMKNLGILDWNWNMSESKIIMNTIHKPSKYFELNVFKQFTKLPTNGRIVQVFNGKITKGPN